MNNRAVNVADVTARADLSTLSVTMVIACGVLAVCDGLDNQALAFTAPVIAQEWGLEMVAFVPVFTVGLVGLMVGSLVGGWLGDRFGRKKTLLASALCFGAATLVTPLCSNIHELMVIRFIGGLGIGGLPVALAALIAETAPERYRASLTLWALAGIPLGGFVGGFGASRMISEYGWQAVFYAAGIFSLVSLLVATFLISESTHFLSARRAQPKQLATILNRIDPDGKYRATDTFSLPAVERQAASVRGLFADGRRPMTLLFWIAEVIELMIFYVLVNWTPTLFRETGLPIETATLGTAALNMGAILAIIMLGPLCRYFGDRRVTAATFLLTSLGLAIAIAGASIAGAGQVSLLMAGIFLAGAGCIGGQSAVVVLMTKAYPTAIRTLGVGWALTVGRIGSIVSPFVVGVPLAMGWSAYQILALPILPSLLGGLCIVLSRKADTGNATAILDHRIPISQKTG